MPSPYQTLPGAEWITRLTTAEGIAIALDPLLLEDYQEESETAKDGGLEYYIHKGEQKHC